MSVDFQPVLVKDSRIGQITDQVPYAVHSGSASNTYQRFPSVASSASNISFNVQIPSESIVVSRDILIDCTVRFRLDITNVAIGANAFAYGTTDCFQSFPVNSLFTTLQATINNTSVSVNLQDVKDSLLCMQSPEQLAKYQGMTPYLRDSFYQQYAQGSQTSNDVFGGWQGSDLDNWYVPRGAHPLVSYTVRYYVANVLQPVPTVVSTDLTDRWEIDIDARFVEPLMLSPFIFGGNYDFNSQGFVGLNSLNIVANIDSSLRRFFSCRPATGATTRTVALSLRSNPFDASLLLNFLTTQPTDLVKAKNIISYLDYPRYLTGTANTTPIPAGATQTITCQNIQLNQVPDLFLISVRRPMSQQTVFDSASFLPITGVSVNFNNSSGLLSSASTEDLWRISRRNGSQQSWLEFSGSASFARLPAVSATAEPLSVPTTGSLLVLSPPYDLSLPAYLSSGSLGQFSFQINITVRNNQVDRTGAGVQITPEVCIIAVNSGLFTTIAGNSAVYTGILTKQMVLDVQQSGDAIDKAEVERMVGGSLANRVASVVKALMPRARRMSTMKPASQKPFASKLDAFTA